MSSLTLILRRGAGWQTAQVAAELPTFTASRLQRGYATAEVDAYLSHVFDVLARGEAVPDSRQASFRVKLGGYDMQEADAFLDDLRKQGHVDGSTAQAVDVAVREGRQAPRIEEAIFGRTYFGGYSEPEVDDYLDTLAGLLGQ